MIYIWAGYLAQKDETLSKPVSISRSSILYPGQVQLCRVRLAEESFHANPVARTG